MLLLKNAKLISISIHALREEGDRWTPKCTRFPSISIHALREEGDAETIKNAGFEIYFYPRPPRGGRPVQSMA